MYFLIYIDFEFIIVTKGIHIIVYDYVFIVLKHKLVVFAV